MLASIASGQCMLLCEKWLNPYGVKLDMDILFPSKERNVNLLLGMLRVSSAKNAQI